jgi:hypothetical protein
MCSLNTPVYTNQQVLENGKPITIVLHDKDDGSWKFYSKEDNMNSNQKVILVSLADMLMIDPSLGEVAHLPEGGIAVRNNIGEAWNFISGKNNARSDIERSVSMRT